MFNAPDNSTSPRPLGRSGSSLHKTPRHNRAPRPKDTPVAKTVNGSKDAESRCVRYANEARKWILGPMPVEEFLDSFLPPRDEDGLKMPDPTHAFKNVQVDASKNEREIYGPLLDDINNFDRCPSIKFVDTSTLPSGSGLVSFKPDSCDYCEDELGAFIREDGKIPADLGHAELFFELKAKNDPFVDPAPNLRNKAKLQEHNFIVIGDKGDLLKAKKSLGQSIAYAAEACARQHRAFYFSVLIVGTHARFVRWDCAGAIVTRAFNYKNKPCYLCDFLWRFGLATPEQRGYDPTVVIASNSEEELFREVISENVAFQLGIDAITHSEALAAAVKHHYQSGKVTKVDVYDEQKRTVEQYLVSRPVKSPISVAGPSTRGYWAVKLSESGGEIAFLKDTWRIDVTDMENEGRIYGKLNEKGVVNISELFSYGDVPEDTEGLRERLEAGGDQGEVLNGQSEPSPEPVPPKAQDENVASADQMSLTPAAQRTRTNEFVNADWACNGCRGGLRVIKHTHFRMALKDVGYPLKDFTGTRELFDGAGDAFQSLTEAYEKCNRLHRDVSLDNIILVRDKETGRRRGILIDWELSTEVDGKGVARDRFRLGTWAYMSGAALEGLHDFRHTQADDMESILYVVVYCAVRWLPHNNMEDLGTWIHGFFEASIFLGGRAQGGDKKHTYIQSKAFTKTFEFTNDFVRTWFRKAYEYLWTRIPGFQEAGIKLQWVSENVRELFDSIRNNTLPDGDRVNHDVGDFYKDIAPPVYATHTSVVVGIDLVADGNAGPSRGANKRTLDEGENGQIQGTGRAPVKEPQRDSKRTRTDMNEEQIVVTGEGTSGQGQNSRGRVSRKDVPRKQSTRRNAPVTNEEPSGTTGARSSLRHAKSGGRASRRNGSGE